MEPNFKKLIYITLFFILVLALFGGFDKPFNDYHNQQFELFYQDENVIIWHSRTLNIPELTRDQHELHGNIWLTYRQQELREKMDSITRWRFHPNYRESLDKYCVDR